MTRTRQLQIFALCFGAAALLTGIPIFLGDGLGSSDGWRHIQWAHLLWDHPPGALREWPVYTVLHAWDADLWWVYHRLLVPFSLLGDLTLGARLAAWVYGSLSLATVGWVLARLSSPARGAWAFAGLLALGPILYGRALTPRPAILTVALAALTALALIERRPRLAFLWAFLYGWVHMSVPLEGVVVLAAAAAWLVTGRRESVSLLLLPLAGAALGVLARPNPLGYIKAALVAGTETFQISMAGFRDLGPELYPPSFYQWLASTPVQLALLLTLVGTIRAWRTGARSREELFLALAALAFLGVASRARRFLAYEETFVALYACRCLRVEGLPERTRRLLRLGALALLPAAMALNALGELTARRYPFTVHQLEGAAAVLRERIPEGAIVFHDDWRAWAKLFFHDPTHRYLVGADPTLMMDLDPHRFWLWYHLGHHGRVCDAPNGSPGACPAVEPTSEQLAAALAEFRAGAIVLSDTGARPLLERLLDRDPDRFPLLYRGRGEDEFVKVYGIRPGAGEVR